jgi:regulator of protease activity HflC (stomatin/prohibitin superfamily)
VRDALVSASSQKNVEYIYGVGKTALLDEVQKNIKAECSPLGIEIDKLYWIGRIKVPDAVKKAIDAKIKATQTAQQMENELRGTEAQAKKKVAEAKGLAESIEIKAIAEAKANRLISASLSKELVEYVKVKRWDGKLPQVTGANALIQLK